MHMSFRYSALVCLATLSISPLYLSAQHAASSEEVTYITDRQRVPDREWQAELRERNAWAGFKNEHPKWAVEFNEYTGMPRRAYGDPIGIAGASPEDKARTFLGSKLAAFGVPAEELTPLATAPTGKLTYVHFQQVHEGMSVLGASAMVKLDGQGRVIAFGADLHSNIETDMMPTLSEPAVLDAAQEGLVDVIGILEVILFYYVYYRNSPVLFSNEIEVVS